MKKLERNNGITLVALIVTIIILIILAGISIAQLTGNGLFEKAKLAKEKSENAQLEENKTLEDYENKIDENIDSSRDNTANYKFNETPVISVSKSSTNTGGTMWLTDNNSDITREYNSTYFDYDEEEGFIVKKSGWYLINMYGHTSSANSGAVTLKIEINDILYQLAGRWNTSNCFGPLMGWMPMYFSKGDIINGKYECNVSGPHHHFYCRIYTFQ